MSARVAASALALALSLALLLALSLAPAACSRPDEPEPRLSGVLITLDTVRADALGCYGGAAGLTPALDRLAAQGLVFDQARTVTPITLPAHASMLTGLYPDRHGVRDNGRDPLPSAATSVAELAHDAGFATAGFVAASVLDRAWGIAQGFEHWSQPRPGLGQGWIAVASLDGFEVAASAIAWLRGRERSRPFFLWLHLYDAHAPYEPPAALQDRAGGAYLGEVAKVDQVVGQVLDVLRAEGLEDEVLVVVLADHGEALGEHGEPTHGLLCYDSTLRIPLLVRAPGVAPARRADPASAVDVFATFVDGLGLAPSPSDGRSLLGAPDPARGVYFESWSGYLNYGFAPLVGWWEGGDKVLASCAADQVYDTGVDPGELVDLAPQADAGPAIARARASIDALLAREPLPVDASRPAPDGALLESLQGLGYAGGGDRVAALPPPLAACDLPDPSGQCAVLVGFDAAILLAEQGRKAEAIEALQALCAANARDVLSHYALARFLMDEQRYAEAGRVAEELVLLRPESLLFAFTAGASYERADDLQGAARHYRRATEIDPSHAGARARLERVTR